MWIGECFVLEEVILNSCVFGGFGERNEMLNLRVWFKVGSLIFFRFVKSRCVTVVFVG